MDASGWTALHYAAQGGSLDFVKLLIEHKADIDATTGKNETALFLATKNNHPHIVEWLAENKCQLKTKGLFVTTTKYSEQKEKEFSALELAAKNNFVEIAKCLLLCLARKKELYEEEVNELLVKAAKKDQVKMANELLAIGANVNYQQGIILYSYLIFLLQ